MIANPSTWVLPNGREDAPYGFDMRTDNRLDRNEEALLRSYLGAPVTVYLGSEDTGDEDLAMSSAARRQGEHRLDRGRRTYEAAKREARSRGWPFNWRLVMADGVGHSGGGMLRSSAMPSTLGLR